MLAHSHGSNRARDRALQSFRVLCFRILPGMVRIPRYSSLSAGLPFILSYPRRRNRLPASTGGAEVTGAGRKTSDVSGFEDGDTASSESSTNEGEWKNTRFEWLQENSAGVASLRGQGTPAYPARLRSERARNSSTILPAAEAERCSRTFMRAGP